MGQHTYLNAIGKLGFLGRRTELLAGKGQIPFGWFLAFDRSARATKSSVVTSGAEGRARAERRIGRLAEVAGPKLRAVLAGFVDMLGQHVSGELEIDASELEFEGDPEEEIRELLDLAARLDVASVDPRAVDLEAWDVVRVNGVQEIRGEGAYATAALLGSSRTASWLVPPRAACAEVPTPTPTIAERLAKALALHPSRSGESFTVDLGTLGHLELEHVDVPEWELHLRARLVEGPGDRSWRNAEGDEAAIDRFLASLAAAARTPEHATLATKAPDAMTPGGALTLVDGRVEPERYTWGFAPARPRQLDEEAPATLVFAGAKLVVVTAKGARFSFRFGAVPKEFDRTLPMFVSGFWTARSGDRFASQLRVGDRVWRFDDAGYVLEA